MPRKKNKQIDYGSRHTTPPLPLPATQHEAIPVGAVWEQRPEPIGKFLDLEVDPDCEVEVLGESWSLMKSYFRQQGRRGVLDNIAARDREVDLLKKQLAETRVALAVAIENATASEKNFQRRLERQKRESDEVQRYLQDQLEGHKRVLEKLSESFQEAQMNLVRVRCRNPGDSLPHQVN